MEITDNDVLDALWPRDGQSQPAPRPVAYAVATMCGGERPDAFYCQRQTYDDDSTWRVFALVGSSFVEVRGRGQDLWRQQVTEDPELPIELARCTPFDSAVRSLDLVKTSPGGDRSRWATQWRLELDTEPLTFPNEGGMTSPDERDRAEAFALAVLRHLHGREN